MSILEACVLSHSLVLAVDLAKGTDPAELKETIDDLAEVHGDAMACEGPERATS